MKIERLLIAALVALTFTACSGDDDDDKGIPGCLIKMADTNYACAEEAAELGEIECDGLAANQAAVYMGVTGSWVNSCPSNGKKCPVEGMTTVHAYGEVTCEIIEASLPTFF